MPEVHEEESDAGFWAESIPRRGNSRCKGPEAGEHLSFSVRSRTVLLKVRTYTYSSDTSKLASICGVIYIESSGGVMQKWTDSTGL